jgi:competence protein ComGC
MKEQAGFTLLKPMLVIAIIGIEFKQVASGKVDLRSRTRSQSG